MFTMEHVSGMLFLNGLVFLIQLKKQTLNNETNF